MRNTLLLLFSLTILSMLAFAALSWRELSSPMPMEGREEIMLDVTHGESIYKVASKLEKEGVLPFARAWVWYARLAGKAEGIKAGEYQIVSGMTPLQLLQNLVEGNVASYSLTIIEGWTSAMAIRAIQETPGIVKTVESENPAEVLAAVGAEEPFTHIEGIFYPDTYRFTKGTEDRSILQRSHQRLVAALDKAWEGRDQNLPYRNPYEVLVMASIVEKETGARSEREQIAGVFVQRLQKKMRLQTDPTVIYGMGESYKGNIRRKDLRAETPYNTYRIAGLPPTPIALPSGASLDAAVHPLLNGMIFFVAKGNGYHYFSRTNAEHERAIGEYQLRRSSSYRSSPAAAPEEEKSE
jgi:UPF0755 protein